MKNRIGYLSILTSLVFTACLAGCGDDSEKLYDTPLTDELKLNEEVEGADFLAPSDGNSALGEVTLTSVVDGDTFNFLNGHVENVKDTTQASLSLRYLGVDTPESTSAVMPWGVKASKFVKSILWDSKKDAQKPYKVVLMNDYGTWGQQDPNDRYLGFVWYKMTPDSDFRLLNLEIIEQFYSKSTLSEDSEYCPYKPYFDAAHKNGMLAKKRVFGEQDPGYDYSDKIYEMSIRHLRENYESYGVSDSSDTDGNTSSGLRLRIVGLIVGFSGNNIILRDVVEPDAKGEFASIYVFSSISVQTASADWKVGDIIKFVCRATTYKGNVQLTDLHHVSSAMSDDAKIVRLVNAAEFGLTSRTSWNDETKVNAITEEAKKVGIENGVKGGYQYSFNPYDKVTDFDSITNKRDLERYLGDYVKVKVTVREGDNLDPHPVGDEVVTDYYRYDDLDTTLNVGTGNCTILVENAKGVHLSLRSLRMTSYYTETDFQLGHTYYVYGQVNKYFEEYQINLPNASARANSGPSMSYVDAESGSTIQTYVMEA